MDIGGHQLSASDVAAKLAHRGRELLKLEQRVGPVCRQIEQRLIDAKTEKIRLLEIGCGYGVALMELRRRFADRIELTRTNRERLHGDMDAMLTAASLRNISDSPDLHSVAFPTIVYGDAADGLPFDDCSFDIV